MPLGFVLQLGAPGPVGGTEAPAETDARSAAAPPVPRPSSIQYHDDCSILNSKSIVVIACHGIVTQVGLVVFLRQLTSIA